MAKAKKMLEANEICHPDHRSSYTDLHLAAKFGLTDELNKILSNPNSDLINTKTKDGFSPLFFAVMYTNEDAVRILLKNGADPNLGKQDKSPLGTAAARGNKPIVQLLLDQKDSAGKPKVDVNAKAYEGYTALHKAAEQGSLDVVNFLLERGADPNIKCKEERLTTFFRPNKDEPVMTPLAMAVMKRRTAIVKVLLDSGKVTNVNEVLMDGDKKVTLQGFAVNHSYHDITKLLIDHGAKLQVPK